MQRTVITGLTPDNYRQVQKKLESNGIDLISDIEDCDKEVGPNHKSKTTYGGTKVKGYHRDNRVYRDCIYMTADEFLGITITRKGNIVDARQALIDGYEVRFTDSPYRHCICYLNKYGGISHIDDTGSYNISFCDNTMRDDAFTIYPKTKPKWRVKHLSQLVHEATSKKRDTTDNSYAMLIGDKWFCLYPGDKSDLHPMHYMCGKEIPVQPGEEYKGYVWHREFLEEVKTVDEFLEEVE